MLSFVNYYPNANISYVHFFIEQSEIENPYIKRGIENHDFFNENEYVELELGIENSTEKIVTKVAVIHDGELGNVSDEITWIDSYDDEICLLAINEYHKEKQIPIYSYLKRGAKWKSYMIWTATINIALLNQYEWLYVKFCFADDKAKEQILSDAIDEVKVELLKRMGDRTEHEKS